MTVDPNRPPICVQSRRDSFYETLTHISAGFTLQLSTEFVVVPYIVAYSIDYAQAMINIAVYVPLRFIVGYLLRRAFVGILSKRYTPIPVNARHMLEIVQERDRMVFDAELARDEAIEQRDALRRELEDLVGTDLVIGNKVAKVEQEPLDSALETVITSLIGVAIFFVGTLFLGLGWAALAKLYALLIVVVPLRFAASFVIRRMFAHRSPLTPFAKDVEGIR